MTALRRFLSRRDATDRAVAKVLGQKWKKKTMRLVFSRMENPNTAETGRLLLGVATAGNALPDLARDAFAGLPDGVLVRYALPEAASALAASDKEDDKNRARALLQAGFETWGKRSRLSATRRLQLAAASATLEKPALLPGNPRPPFTSFHIADPEILTEESLKYLRRFAPIGCRDLLTARLLRGAGVKAFVGSATMKRTDAMIAERNAKYPLHDFPVAELGLDRIPVQAFGPASDPKNNPVHILFAFDENLAEVFPGTLEGIRRHATRPLVIHIFGRGLSTVMFERWAALFKTVRFIHRDLSGVTFGDGLDLDEGVTVSTMDRLLAPALLPDLERVIWLDVDILVRRDISRLFDTRLGDAPLAARRDVSGGIGVGANCLFRYDADGAQPEERREAFHNAFFSGETVFEGFNAGVLVMSLARMRRERMMEKTFALVRTCGVHDQTALNLTTRRRWKPLADKWNFYSAYEFPGDPAIVHFISPKPWVEDLPVPFMREWRENAARVAPR